jgi:hypothetical protein
MVDLEGLVSLHVLGSGGLHGVNFACEVLQPCDVTSGVGSHNNIFVLGSRHSNNT